MTLIFAPPRTIVALTVLRSIGSNCAARAPSRRSAASVRRGFSSERMIAAWRRGSAAAIASTISSHDRRHVHGHPLPVEVGEEAAEPGDRPAAVHHRAVPAGPAHRRLQPADLLLGHLDRVEALAADVEREAAELAERVAHPLEQLGMLLDEELRAEVAAGLLVGEDDEHDVARELHALALRAQEGVNEHRDARLHVERAAAPDVAVLELGLERRVRPVLAGRRDDVDVAWSRSGGASPPARRLTRFGRPGSRA